MPTPIADSVAQQAVANYPEILLSDKPIAFNRDFVRLGIGVSGALMLSQAIYWARRTKVEDLSFYKVVSEWEEETGLTKAEQLTAKKRLIAKGYLKVVKKGVPAKNYYYVDMEKVAMDIIKSSVKSTTSRPESRPLVVVNQDNIHIQRIHTENTTKSCELSSQVKKLMDIFYKINPTINWGNKTTLKAAADLIQRFGLEETLAMAQQIVAVQGKAYAPVATTPYEMREKLAKFRAYFSAEKDKHPKITKV